ncbi:hypothetical protein WA026_011692 [Henosepilachna vigintioctopunctata]|uniref:Uncharacterized protein n=1 Tax=Henosepilachna vigintioctopunctata TaxID=420089 RepID=A0AAW1UHV4_9CUCU
MDLTNRLQESFSKLGYFGTIPIPPQKNPSTSFIWEQFIRNVKPKNQVDTCRKNIIINRLQKKLSVENYPIQEIQVYNELKAVKENIEVVKKRIQEKQNREAFLREANKSNYLQITSLKDHIEEKKIKLHALKLKATDMRSRLELMDTTKTKGIALVSDDNSLSPENVTNILKTLVETIEKLSPKCSSTHQDKYMMSSYHNISRIQTPRKKCHSTIKKNKVNIPRFQRFSSCVK